MDRGFGSVRVCVDREDGWGSVDVEVKWLAGGTVVGLKGGAWLVGGGRW